MHASLAQLSQCEWPLLVCAVSRGGKLADCCGHAAASSMCMHHLSTVLLGHHTDAIISTPMLPAARYTRWGTRQPDESFPSSCAGADAKLALSGTWGWNSEPCNRAAPFMCKQSEWPLIASVVRAPLCFCRSCSPHRCLTQACAMSNAIP
jgi:hypothetical protein